MKKANYLYGLMAIFTLALALKWHRVSQDASPAAEETTSVMEEVTKSAEKNPVVVPAKEALSSEEKEFRKQSKDLLEALPTVNIIKNAPADEDFHHAPKALFAAGEILGKVVDATDANPGLLPAAMDFYAQCAKNTEILMSVRAVCLSHLIKKGPLTKIQLRLNEYPEDLRRLAEGL